MPNIELFTGLQKLLGHSRTGLNNTINSFTSIIVVGDGLDGFTLWVTKKDGSMPWWTGQLSSIGVAGRWKAQLECKYSMSGDGSDAIPPPGTGDGDPADVPVTVSAGTNTNDPQATLNTTVPVGTGTP
jgi:hypothetical protein